MNTKSLTSLAVAAMMGFMAQAATVAWQPSVDQMIANGEFAKAEQFLKQLPKAERKEQAVRIDSLNTIMQRIRADFTLTPAEGIAKIKERMPQVTEAQIEKWKATKKIEYMIIDGKECWFRKSVGNLWLLADELATDHAADKTDSYNYHRGHYLAAMKTTPDANGTRDWNKVQITFKLDVKADAVPAGETVKVWMPYPFENLRQRNIHFIKSNRPVTFSDGSKHHTVYMEAVAEKGKPLHFEYTFSYEVGERHIAKQDMLALLQPYDKNSEVYKRYTLKNEGPHIAVDEKIAAKAKEIVGNETNPVEQASLLCQWIGRNFPWAGAREYSTIANIPSYVLENGHGDCGQVALLYINMARSLGIPARWESGYMLHPGYENYHDWAETYYEGIGWVSTDPSFCRTTVDTPLNDYYVTGLDVYRLATNEAVGEVFSPRKTYIRSETVDCQAGEVEWKGGNLYYDCFSSEMNVDSFVPVK